MNPDAEQLHASAVAIGGRGILLLGPSGAGKSDLALRLIDDGAVLVADDRVDIAVSEADVFLSPPNVLAGLLEVRGVGIVRRDHEAKVSLSLVVDLVKPDQVPRLPESLVGDFMGAAVRRIALDPFEASALAKIRLALTVKDEDMLET
ncbi:MAG: serine/threonine protein kinase [Rhodospirillales bacterium]|nr:serine/threonine protein kinase [Rhodospirillales bacterium]MBO6785401.1 serine/threonine protein kinase [Rhodospirillales bacterium]